MDLSLQLTLDEQQLLDQMKVVVSKEINELLKNEPQLIEKYIDTNQLIRILKARQFQLDKAIEMWQKWVQWRLQFGADSIPYESIISEIKKGKAFFHKHDKMGNPCIIVKLKQHIPSESNVNDCQKFFVYLMEKGIKMAEKAGTGRLAVIWDREGFQRKNFDQRFIEQVKALVGVFQDNYAERLSATYILYPNWLMRWAYNIFKPFLAKKVQEKIKIMNNLDELKNYFDSDCLLQEHGGTSQYQYNWEDAIRNENEEGESQYYSIDNNSEEFYHQRKKDQQQICIDLGQYQPRMYYEDDDINPLIEGSKKINTNNQIILESQEENAICCACSRNELCTIF